MGFWAKARRAEKPQPSMREIIQVIDRPFKPSIADRIAFAQQEIIRAIRPKPGKQVSIKQKQIDQVSIQLKSGKWVSLRSQLVPETVEKSEPNTEQKAE